MASMRRTPAAADCSTAILKTPMSPVRRDVRAAAKLLAVKAARRGGIGNGHHADVLFRVAVAEEGQSAGSERVVQRGDVGLDLGVEQNFVVHLLLDVAQFGRIDRSEVREIEAQACWLDQRAGLLDVRAENVAQRGVHQVRRGVIALDVLAPRAVGFSRDAIAHGQFFLCHERGARSGPRRDNTRRALRQLHRVLVVPQRADVGDLSARFGVKHRAVEDNFAFRARREFVYRAVLGDDGFDAAIFRARLKIEIRLGAVRFRRASRTRDWRLPCARLSRMRVRGCAAPPSRGQIQAN